MLSPSRRSAALALHAVFGDSRRVPEGWDRDLSPEDAALARAMLGLTLRRWGRLQAWFEARLKDPRRGAPLGSRIAAALGFTQLAWLSGVSAHAAVHESVELAGDRELGFPPHRGLVNAILRAASRDRSALAAGLETLPPHLDHSPFVLRAAESALRPRGQSALAPVLLERLQHEPVPAFVDLGGAPIPDGLVPVEGQPGALRLVPGAPFPRAWLMEGHGMVQDLSSQALMGFACATEPLDILDVCAAPGGKTTALARRFPTARVTALERDPRRAERLKANLQARGTTATVHVADAAPWLLATDQTFDLILLDAPCSGSGTLQKHPELTWIGDSLQVHRLQGAQARLLEAALSRLRPGGLLIYAVCSWFPEEGLNHLAPLQEHHPDVVPAAVWDASFGLDGAASSRFLPDPLTWEGEGFQGFAVRRLDPQRSCSALESA